MPNDNTPLNFIEIIVEEDLKNETYNKKELRFRFPPEPNGFLHIGHAKSICLNFGLGEKYNAPVNLRFDDTNPVKEDKKFVEAIKKDIEWLGFRWDEECYASDYFQQLYDWAVLLIKKGNAYVDSQSSAEIADQKGAPTQEGKESPFRNRSVEENLKIFEQMKNGNFKEGEHVLRAKINMASSNMLMRDPIMYRIIHKPHQRTKNKWHIYPMYDWTHGESDYIEQVTHSFCSLEFAMHRELYEWFVQQVYEPSKVKSKQREFARLNLSYTVMSKRKLAQLVEEKIVNDWDDPRMPTLSGLRRRGYTPESIRKFCDTVGIAKRDNLIEIALLEFCIREHLNTIAPRVMGIIDPIKVIITNYPEGKEEWLEAESSPDETEKNYRKVPFSRELYIEKEDFREEANRKFFRLKIGGEVRLKNAYIIKAEKTIKNGKGEITEIHCTYDTKSKSGSGTEESLRKVKGTLHWVSILHALKVTVNHYNPLFTHPEPDLCDGGFTSAINSNSLVVSKAFVEPSLKGVNAGDKFQFQRIGYFCVDTNSSIDNLIFNKTVGLRDTWAKVNAQNG